ncbi:PEP-CTERM sorting domain-containing protein [Bythopirellula polymerisocia]|uniref:PEP-CTERM motif protein n=1 Tax=Bythopirellula polymerisocia TaxID=2528003 RepID=A0A5C6C802_9BACT|nr:PEP-CTERM sorting domain-containing protein [Bythopirellula polymerisocia]TWU20783.1 PEP-CTERM motif protein [Bythopirellula polymerisocia]
MKKNNKVSNKLCMQAVTKRLTAYSAAAGLGAFACGETAEATVVYADVPDIVVNATNPTGGYYDMDGDTVPDFRFRFQPGYAPAGIRFQGYGDSDELTNTSKGSAYYLRSFESGDSIGPGAVTTSNGFGIASSNATNFGNPTDPQYAGILLDIGGSSHYGWVRIKTEKVGGETTLTGTIFDWAYETTPDTAIAAGAIPEPTSLALLAAGAGALALRRRSA